MTPSDAGKTGREEDRFFACGCRFGDVSADTCQAHRKLLSLKMPLREQRELLEAWVSPVESALRSRHDELREAADVLAEATRELLMHGSAVQVGEHPETGEPIAEQFQANPQHAIDALAHYESSKSATKGGSQCVQ